MPITSSDLKVRLSVPTASSGNADSQADPNASLGKYISTTDIVDDTINNLFDDISGDENAAETVDYRCIFLFNNHASLTWQAPVVWLSGRRSTADGSTDVITASGHGFADGDGVRVEAELITDSLPSGLDNSTTYFVRDSDANTFALASTVGGGALDIGDSSGFATRAYGTTLMALGVDPFPSSLANATGVQAVTVADELTEPTGVSFSSPITKSAGLSLGNIGPSGVKAVWVRRTATNSQARNNDMAVLGYRGDTAA